MTTDQGGVRVSADIGRRELLAGAVAFAPVAVEAGAGRRPVRDLPRPVVSGPADFAGVAGELGRPGAVLGGVYYHTAFPRTDLRVVSHGVVISPGLLGSHVSFARYDDGLSLLMGDLITTEGELQGFCDAVQRAGIVITAIHKHLLAQFPEVWWLHVCAADRRPERLAGGMRAALDRTATPPPAPFVPEERIDLDTAGVDQALGGGGQVQGGIYTCAFRRRETVTDDGRILPPGLGAISAFNFQPLGGGRAALSGDFVMTADEVPGTLTRLRRSGIDLVSLHNHALSDVPRLFFTHLWAVDDAVALAKALRPALDGTNTEPVRSLG